MTFDRNSARSKQGFGFEKWVQEALQPRFTVWSSYERFTVLYEEHVVPMLKSFNALPGWDCEHGDLHIEHRGRTPLHISCKSTSGNTISCSKQHIQSFPQKGRFFIVAHTDENGVPVGEVMLVPAMEMKRLWSLYAKDSNDAGNQFMGLQHILGSDETVFGMEYINGALYDALSHLPDSP